MFHVIAKFLIHELNERQNGLPLAPHKSETDLGPQQTHPALTSSVMASTSRC